MGLDGGLCVRFLVSGRTGGEGGGGEEEETECWGEGGAVVIGTVEIER